MQYLPNELLNIICEYYVDNLYGLIIILSIFPEKRFNIEDRPYFKKFGNISSYRQNLCRLIQEKQLNYIRILLTKFDYIINNEEFADICKYNSREVVETIHTYNRGDVCLYVAINGALYTHNNITLEWLYRQL